MIINDPKEVLEYLLEDPTDLIFGFDNDSEIWVRVQYMTVQEIIESQNPFHRIRLGIKCKEDSDFLIQLLAINYGRYVVDCK